MCSAASPAPRSTTIAASVAYATDEIASGGEDRQRERDREELVLRLVRLHRPADEQTARAPRRLDRRSGRNVLLRGAHRANGRAPAGRVRRLGRAAGGADPGRPGRGRLEDERLGRRVREEPRQLLLREAAAAVHRGGRDDAVEPLDLPQPPQRVGQRPALLDPRVDRRRRRAAPRARPPRAAASRSSPRPSAASPRRSAAARSAGTPARAPPPPPGRCGSPRRARSRRAGRRTGRECGARSRTPEGASAAAGGAARRRARPRGRSRRRAGRRRAGSPHRLRPVGAVRDDADVDPRQLADERGDERAAQDLAAAALVRRADEDVRRAALVDERGAPWRRARRPPPRGSARRARWRGGAARRARPAPPPRAASPDCAPTARRAARRGARPSARPAAGSAATAAPA